MSLSAEFLMSIPSPSGLYTEVGDPDFKIDLVVNDGPHVYVFHNKHFRKELSWIEYNTADNRLEFVMKDGDTRDFGAPVPRRLQANLTRAQRVLCVLVDEETLEPLEGDYFPLLINMDGNPA